MKTLRAKSTPNKLRAMMALVAVELMARKRGDTVRVQRSANGIAFANFSAWLEPAPRGGTLAVICDSAFADASNGELFAVPVTGRNVRKINARAVRA
jgi:hypothetical protein